MPKKLYMVDKATYTEEDKISQKPLRVTTSQSKNKGIETSRPSQSSELRGYPIPKTSTIITCDTDRQQMPNKSFSIQALNKTK